MKSLDLEDMKVVDQLKRDICKENGIILIEIYENVKADQWVSRIIDQIGK